MATRQEIVEEMWHVQRDLEAFKKSRDAINARILELEDDYRLDRFVTWAGTQAAMNVLIMCIVRCEGLIEDYKKNLESLSPDPGQLN